MPMSKQELQNIERNSAYQLKAMSALFDLIDEDRKEAEKKRQQEREDTNANEELG